MTVQDKIIPQYCIPVDKKSGIYISQNFDVDIRGSKDISTSKSQFWKHIFFWCGQFLFDILCIVWVMETLPTEIQQVLARKNRTVDESSASDKAEEARWLARRFARAGGSSSWTSVLSSWCPFTNWKLKHKMTRSSRLSVCINTALWQKSYPPCILHVPSMYGQTLHVHPCTSMYPPCSPPCTLHVSSM